MELATDMQYKTSRLGLKGPPPGATTSFKAHCLDFYIAWRALQAHDFSHFPSMLIEEIHARRLHTDAG